VWTPSALRAYRTAWQVVGVVAVVLVLAAITAWRTAQILEYVAPLGL
jgi:hypothetical protein